MSICSYTSGKKQVPLIMDIGNGELTHERPPKHPRMGTARMKQEKETEEEGKRGVNIWKEVQRARKKNPDGLNKSLPS